MLSLPLLPLGSPIHQVRVAREIFLNNAQLGGGWGAGDGVTAQLKTSHGSSLATDCNKYSPAWRVKLSEI